MRAKTGSMSNVRGLSGYVNSADGEPLVFAILANNFELDAECDQHGDRRDRRQARRIQTLKTSAALNARRRTGRDPALNFGTITGSPFVAPGAVVVVCGGTQHDLVQRETILAHLDLTRGSDPGI